MKNNNILILFALLSLVLPGAFLSAQEDWTLYRFENICYIYGASSSETCQAADKGCKDLYGQNSFYTGEVTSLDNYICECWDGYAWNEDRDACSEPQCPDGDIYYSQYRDKTGKFLQGRCVSYDQACQAEHGELSAFTFTDVNGFDHCGCQAGSTWEGGVCVEEVQVLGIESPSLEEIIYEETINEEKNLFVATDNSLIDRAKGRILLQVEKNGEAWYLEPEQKQKYFLGSPAQAFRVMQQFGLGVKHDFISGQTVFPKQVRGKILIDVEDLGKAYYINPADSLAYYLGRPTDAWRVMRELGLGISNFNLWHIPVGELGSN